MTFEIDEFAVVRGGFRGEHPDRPRLGTRQFDPAGARIGSEHEQGGMWSAERIEQPDRPVVPVGQRCIGRPIAGPDTPPASVVKSASSVDAIGYLAASALLQAVEAGALDLTDDEAVDTLTRFMYRGLTGRDIESAP
ncbi:hypothetical protein [Nocardia sp. NPDC020380]|uniref:hypothetical protein n=1 Tax=Nocardia sp. NPDC020380 TaxID=3364309 RepID=UPI0037B5AD48